MHIVPYDSLAASLNSLNITPRTQVSADWTLYTYWREDVNASISYDYIYNDAWDSELGDGFTTGSMTFEATGKPYLYDAWTGEVSPISAYQQTASSTTISVALAGNQSTIIGFHHNEDSSAHSISVPEEAYSAVIEEEGQLSIKSGLATQPVLLSNGTGISLQSPPAPSQLDVWSLTVESWSPPADLEADQTQPLLSNSTFNISSLKPWNAISESLRNVSGRGFFFDVFHLATCEWKRGWRGPRAWSYIQHSWGVG